MPLLASLAWLAFDFMFLVNKYLYRFHFSRLTQINDRMSGVVNVMSPDGAPYTNVTQQHTTKRHREILFDYSQDFKRMRTNYINAKNREELLTAVCFLGN